MSAKLISLKNLNFAKYLNYVRNSTVISKTELKFSDRYSKKFNCNVWLKREDSQSVRSFKIRGAFCKIMEEMQKRSDVSPPPMIVTASAGNHAQGVALTCKSLNLPNTIFVPVNTPSQKISRIQHFADYANNKNFQLKLSGSTFDESCATALEYCAAQNREENGAIFVHPFDDMDVILGQSTIAQEIYEQMNEEFNANPDVIVCTVGGGGLISGTALYSKSVNPECDIIGVEPLYANSMQVSLMEKRRVTLENIDTFVDGASVKTVGDLTFQVCSQNVYGGRMPYVREILTVGNGELCCDILDMYKNEGIIVEPAGVMPITALSQLVEKGGITTDTNICCIVSGGNNDVNRYPEMMEKCRNRQGKMYSENLQSNEIAC